MRNVSVYINTWCLIINQAGILITSPSLPIKSPKINQNSKKDKVTGFCDFFVDYILSIFEWIFSTHVNLVDNFLLKIVVFG